MHIYIMRHGQSMANAHKIVSGSRNTPLSELGKAQARLAAHDTSKLGIDLIVCSPLLRAKDTAHIIAEAIDYPAKEIKVVEGFEERHLGELEGKSYAQDRLVSGDYIETNDQFGMEPIAHFHSRVQAALRDILTSRRYNNVLVICHNTVGRMLEAVAANKPALSMFDSPRLENGLIKRLL